MDQIWTNRLLTCKKRTCTNLAITKTITAFSLSVMGARYDNTHFEAALHAFILAYTQREQVVLVNSQCFNETDCNSTPTTDSMLLFFTLAESTVSIIRVLEAVDTRISYFLRRIKIESHSTEHSVGCLSTWFEQKQRGCKKLAGR